MKILLFLALIYASFCLYLYFFQEKIIFRPDLAPKDVELPKNARRLFLDDIEIGYIEKQSDTTIFYFGGNANNALEFLHIVADLPYNAVAFNYPGYANSAGKPSQQSLFAAAKKIFEHFKTRKNILIGRSLGSGVAAYIASLGKVDGIILITPYHSLLHLAKLRYPICPASLLLKHPFNTCSYIQKTLAPVFIIAAEHDTTTPPATLHKLLPCIVNLKKIITIPGSTHADILQFNTTKEAIRKFLQLLAPPSLR